ncbi:ubiquitin-like activating enzyme 4 isoform X2 [Anticarsia gemmatalis]|uniref:ubiquitin-like activating enzyme 4 isoform X2 n=1 Tax=Anticarsia gemmatalis TaxID=129554 RepID=UPI003F76AE1D
MDQIQKVEQEILELRQKLREKEDELYALKLNYHSSQSAQAHNGDESQITEETTIKQWTLPKWAIERYSRQILLREIGVAGQARICAAKVLIVGAGGLGCPAAMYLAGAGVGEIGIVDYDTVEISNIHRQLLHREIDTDVNKAESAARAIRSINSHIKVTPYKVQLDSTNAIQIASKYDVVLDCTDNAPTRYLLSDLCVLAKLPLISGSALKLEGQLTVYCYRADLHSVDKSSTYRGPCYRCVFSVPPSPDALGSCSQHGVAPPVPGVIGTLQATEALKFIIGHPSRNLLVERMLIMDVDDMSCKVVQLRPRNPMCAICSDTPTITQLIDYEVFCKTQAKEKELDLKILPPMNRITAVELQTLLLSKSTLLLDVRSAAEFDMCNIDGADNWPIDYVDRRLEELLKKTEENDGAVVFICRRGNDSQIAAKMLLDKLPEAHRHKVKDMEGGLHAWAKYVDKDFPVY